MQSTRVTGLTLVPSLLNAMLKGFPEAPLWAQLRLCLVSGEAVDAGLPERFSRLCPGARLFNLYGSAEVSTDASWCELRAGQAVLAGRPLPDVCIEIVDSRGQLSPLGCPGEIRISGAGYRPGESFLTGDLGRWQRGQLEILGRRDQQLCVRGVRVEAAEVQGRLLTWPDLLEVEVVASQDGQHWGAFYRTALKSPTEPAQLRPWLLHQLPGYLVPDALIQLEDFPRLSSGKVDRAALQALLGQPTRPGSAPADPLARLWCEVLRLEKVAEQDDFFALGGHSLLALHFVQHCQTRLGLRLTLAALLENPSLESLRLHLTHPGLERLQHIPRARQHQVRETSIHKYAFRLSALENPLEREAESFCFVWQVPLLTIGFVIVDARRSMGAPCKATLPKWTPKQSCDDWPWPRMSPYC